MISERSANRGSCAQSCRKDYVLTDVDDARGARPRLSDLGEGPRRVRSSRRDRRRGHRLPQGRRAKEEARVRRDRHATAIATSSTASSRATRTPPSRRGSQPLVQIFSRGFTGGMYGGRAGRDYVTRTQPDNRGVELGAVVGLRARRVDRRRVARRFAIGDGLGFEAPGQRRRSDDGLQRHHRAHARHARRRHASGARDAHARRRRAGAWCARRRRALLERARASYAALPHRDSRAQDRARRARCSARAGRRSRRCSSRTARRSRCAARSRSRRRRSARSTSRSCASSSAGSATRRSCSATLDVAALADGLFLPVSELNHLRQQAVEQLMLRRDWAREREARERERARSSAAVARRRIAAVAPRATHRAPPTAVRSPRRSISLDDARRGRGRRRDGDRASIRSFVIPRRRVARVRALAERARGAGRRRCACARRRSCAPKTGSSIAEVARPRPAAAQRTPRARRASWRARVATSSPTTRSTASTSTRRPSCSGSARGASSRRSSSRPTSCSQLVAPWDGDGFDVLALRPPRRDDDRALRALGGVRSRADDLPRSLRAEAHERRAHRSRGLHVPGRDRLGVPQSSAALASGRWRRSSCRGSGARAFAATSSCSTCPGDDVARDRRPAIARCSMRWRPAQRPDAERGAPARQRRVHARPFRARGLATHAGDGSDDAFARVARARSSRMTTRPSHTHRRRARRAARALRLSGVSARDRKRPSSPCSPAATRSSSCRPAAASRSAIRCRR